MKRFLAGGASVVVLIVVIAAAAASQFSLSAVPEPGHTETYLANQAKRYLIRRNSREGIPPPPPDLKASIKEGDDLFGTECAACHRMSGLNPTDAGRWMYPRAADLTSRNVQSYSDRELFWIVKNGIRLSGMPAFGRVESNEHIWNLVRYVRTLPAAAKAH
jgi:mono/diheme cytochrome c family protein